MSLFLPALALAANRIVVSKSDYTPTVVSDKGKLLYKCRIAYGKNPGNKVGTGFISIGIHGTCFPESIGTRSSEGCIRCLNEDVSEFVKYISVGSEVTILPDKNLQIR